MDKLTTCAFMPVRHSSQGYDYVAYWESSASAETSAVRANKNDVEAPNWAKNNPVVRIAEFEITEK